MDQPSRPPPFFPRQSGIPSTTPSTAELDSQQRFLTSFLDSTRALVGFTDTHVAPYAPGDLEALSTGEQALIPLLCSTLHAVSNIGQAVQELRQDFASLRVQMTNASLPGDKLAAIQSSLRDLSLRVATTVPHPPSAPPPPLVSSSRPTPPVHTVGGRPPPPPHSARPPPSFAQVVGGESNLDQAAREQFGPGGVDGGKAKKKKNAKRSPTSANQVASAVAESYIPRPPAPLPNAVRHFFAPRSFPLPDSDNFA